MRKILLVLCAVLLLCGCAPKEDPQVTSLREQILALPAVEEVQSQELDSQLEIYNQTQSVYDAYMALTEEQQTQIEGAEAVFDSLFSYFNSLVQAIEEANTLREEILSLPTVEEFQLLDSDGQLEAYNRTQSAYDAYMALTEVQKGQIGEAEAIFETLFAHYNSLIAPAEAEELLYLTDEDRQLLLQIGMAELGSGDCTECIALVMRTVLNRVESDRFPSTVRNVIYAQDQFTPVVDGTFAKAEPNERCFAALDMVLRGWDESQGALYYEWCEGESWHSKNLHLLFQHCDTRFYD